MKNKTKWIWEAGFALLGILAFALVYDRAGNMFREEELIPIMDWWKTLLVLGIGFFPLTAYIFRKFSDKGYIFGKILGLVISGWLVWVCSSLHIVKFTGAGCFVLPAILSWVFCVILRKIGWIKEGDLKLDL